MLNLNHIPSLTQWCYWESTFSDFNLLPPSCAFTGTGQLVLSLTRPSQQQIHKENSKLVKGILSILYSSICCPWSHCKLKFITVTSILVLFQCHSDRMPMQLNIANLSINKLSVKHVHGNYIWYVFLKQISTFWSSGVMEKIFVMSYFLKIFYLLNEVIFYILYLEPNVKQSLRVMNMRWRYMMCICS